ncbi:hypothetical protein B0G81_2356 [Paraburkholderia sp. BL6665CI2N2]|uniref:hypothetical protein n=1 Tax=Paraburkholderia sp. BL6665CI2N2 TaxID=1938806 RepID=UPI0010E7A265|nr:hypothetical protein [Paraburkholderia sp. BL6665CI2N2]TDY22076.1 hypothetical protein B0G81_2356 [Paraburkholderia sp. BL6665CI2N2]
MAALEANGGVASRSELRSALTDIKLITYPTALMTTPIFRLVNHGIYTVVGRPLGPIAFMRAMSRREGMLNRIEASRHPDGNVSFPYIIAEFAAKSKVCTIPPSAVSHVPAGEYRIRDSSFDC